jgi:gas vesicle structural protein
MGVAQATSGGCLERHRPSGLADVLEILTIAARIVIASVDAYLRFAEAVHRMEIVESSDARTFPELVESMTSGGSKSKTKGALEGAKETLFAGDDDEESKERPRRRRRASSSR